MTQPVRKVYVTAPFGIKGSWAAGYHTGVDFRASVGTKIFATKRGRVIHTGWGGYGNAYGHQIIIRSWHRGRRITHLYAHMSKSFVKKGQVVKTGARIGLSGNTGNTTAPHLHYEERVSPFGYYNHRRPVLPNWEPFRAPSVSLSAVQKATKPNKNIKKIQRKLNAKFPKWSKLERTGRWDTRTKRRYRAWQKRLGYSDDRATGRPDQNSLERLGFKIKP